MGASDPIEELISTSRAEVVVVSEKLRTHFQAELVLTGTLARKIQLLEKHGGGRLRHRTQS
jgi:hypothetical protein